MSAEAAAERVRAFLDMRAPMLGIDHETITSVHSGDADEPAPLTTTDLRALVDAVLPTPGRVTVTMYLPHVSERYQHTDTPLAARTIMPTLAGAKAVLDVERRVHGSPPLDWTDEFGGATATDGGLRYDVVPVEVATP